MRSACRAIGVSALVLSAGGSWSCRDRSALTATDAGMISNDGSGVDAPTDVAAAVSCGGGTVTASGTTAEGPFVATAINVFGRWCGSFTNVQFLIAGESSSAASISFIVQAQPLGDAGVGEGVRLPTGQSSVQANIDGRQATATVTITAADDAPLTPDAGPVSHIEGSFTVVDGAHTVTGSFSCPFCYVDPCPPGGT